MQVRSGLGQSGETILVGPDGRMRSDSLLKPTTRSVAASFRNATTMVDTAASRAALAGETGLATIKEGGVEFFSAYAPLNAWGARWGILGEIRKDEVLAPVDSLRRQLQLAAGGIGTVVLGIALLSAWSIASPLHALRKVAENIACGRFDHCLTINQRDEIGQVAASMDSIPTVLGRILSETAAVAEDIIHGRLRSRLKDVAFEGEYRRLTANINGMLDEYTRQIDNIPMPVMAMAPEFTLQFINHTGAALGGKAAEELRGCKCFDLFHSEDCRTERCALARAMASGEQCRSLTTGRPVSPST